MGGDAKTGREVRKRQLPSGRHGLSREYVAANQRERILDAVALHASRSGYWGMSLDSIAAASGTSRRTFYTLFESKEAAFLTLCDVTAEQMLATVYAAYDSSEPLAERGFHCMAAIIGFLCEYPDRANVIFVQVLTAGPAAVTRRDLALQHLADLVERAVSDGGERDLPPSTTAEAVVGGLYQIIYGRILNDRVSELRDLMPEMLFMLLMPYIGHRAAATARARATEVLSAAPPS